MSDTTTSELLAQIATLELEEHTVSARRRRLHERLAIFPSEEGQEAERELSAHRRALHRAIDEARAELDAHQGVEQAASRSTLDS